MTEPASEFVTYRSAAARSSGWPASSPGTDGTTVAVLGNFMGGRDPRRSARVRDEILERLRDGQITASRHRDRRPGERTVLSTLGHVSQDIAQHAVKSRAIIVVGDVVALAHPEHPAYRGLA